MNVRMTKGFLEELKFTEGAWLSGTTDPRKIALVDALGKAQSVSRDVAEVMLDADAQEWLRDVALPELLDRWKDWGSTGAALRRVGGRVLEELKAAQS